MLLSLTHITDGVSSGRENSGREKYDGNSEKPPHHPAVNNVIRNEVNDKDEAKNI